MASSRENIQQSVVLLAFTAAVVILRDYVWYGFHWLSQLHAWFDNHLAMIFSGSHWGAILRQTLSISLVAIGITSVLALLYWFVKKQSLPWFKCVLWLLWVCLVTMFVYHAA